MRYRIITLTQGNIVHHHLSLTHAWDLVPTDAVGGSNDDDLAPAQLEVHYGLDHPVMTDIAGDKKIFRKRAWVRDFFREHALSAGAQVVIERTGTYRFHVYPARA